MMDYNRIEIKDSDKKQVGFICGFCDRVFEDMASVKQVVTGKKSLLNTSGKKLKWICDICMDQDKTIAIDGTIIINNKTGITIEEIRMEWDNKIFSKYRRELWKK